MVLFFLIFLPFAILVSLSKYSFFSIPFYSPKHQNASKNNHHIPTKTTTTNYLHNNDNYNNYKPSFLLDIGLYAAFLHLLRVPHLPQRKLVLAQCIVFPGPRSYSLSLFLRHTIWCGRFYSWEAHLAPTHKAAGNRQDQQ